MVQRATDMGEGKTGDAIIHEFNVKNEKESKGNKIKTAGYKRGQGVFFV